MRTATAARAVQDSRARILAAIGDPEDLTLVRTPGNLGDELIYRGTAALLSGHIYRELDVTELCGAGGDTVVLQGGGAFCRAFHELMPRALAVAELRFRRVIVLPASFDAHVPAVRDVLMRSRATVFAREPVSERQLLSLCDVRLAHDCAFFVDYRAWRAAGVGTLNAFRTDPESTGRVPFAPDNDDISLTEADLDAWLERIAAHELVRTDRAHVMIAAALMGRRVEYAPSNYHKVAAIAEYSLPEYPVTPLELPAVREPVRRPRPRPRSNGTPPRVSAVILTHDRGAEALRAIDSLGDNEVSFDVLVVDQDSAPVHAETLRDGSAGLDHVRIRRLDRNLGCAGGRRLGPAATTGELILFLDDDAELTPGSLDALVAELDAHPEAQAVSATVVQSHGVVFHSGGMLHVADGVAEFSLVADGRPVSEPVPPSGAAGWVPGTAALIRRELLEQVPIDDGMAAYFEENEWAMRVRRRFPAAFRRSPLARAIHTSTKVPPAPGFAAKSLAADWLSAHARFYERHGLLLGPSLFQVVPELVDQHGERDLAAARLLMELVLARGSDWLFMEWMNGGLASIIGGRAREVAQQSVLRELQAELATLAGEAERREEELRAAREQAAAARVEQQAATAAVEQQAEILAYLHNRHLTLHAIEHGGWWRLRNRLLAVARLITGKRRG